MPSLSENTRHRRLDCIGGDTRSLVGTEPLRGEYEKSGARHIRREPPKRTYNRVARRATVSYGPVSATQAIRYGVGHGCRCDNRRYSAKHAPCYRRRPHSVAMGLHQPHIACGQVGGHARRRRTLRADDLVRMRARRLPARRGTGDARTPRQEPDNTQDRRCNQHRLHKAQGAFHSRQPEIQPQKVVHRTVRHHQELPCRRQEA